MSSLVRLDNKIKNFSKIMIVGYATEDVSHTLTAEN